MAKPAPGVRLLRSLTRLLTAATPKPPKPSRKVRAKRPAKQTAPLPIRKHARPELRTAPGKWLAAQFPAPLASGYPAGHSLSYWLYLPDRAPDTVARNGWPLIVMLHGCHQSATEFAQGTRMNWLADQKGYALLYPQQSPRVQPQRCWRWYERSVQQGAGETAVLAGLIGSVSERHPIDRRRVYACGISAGAGMAAVLALNHPEVIAAVAMHSGPVFGAGHSPVGALHVMRHGDAAQAGAAIHGVLQRRSAQSPPAVAGPMPPMPALLIQGDDDRIVHPVNQQQLARQWLQLNGVPVGATARVALKPAARRGGRNACEIHDYLVGRKVLLRVARITGLGHAWSGGDPALRFNAKAGPDASRMVLDFLGKHRR